MWRPSQQVRQKDSGRFGHFGCHLGLQAQRPKRRVEGKFLRSASWSCLVFRMNFGWSRNKWGREWGTWLFKAKECSVLEKDLRRSPGLNLIAPAVWNCMYGPVKDCHLTGDAFSLTLSLVIATYASACKIFSCPGQLNRWPCHWLSD